MTLEKAIEILECKIRGANPYPSQDTDDACRLGIGALKRTIEARISQVCLCNEYLPGETEK